jgi:hypothetical protein
MEVKNIEGVEYILKSDVDELVRSRVSKVSERARAAESRVAELEESVEANKTASSQLSDLQLKIDSLTGELEQSKNLYSTHSTIAKHGFIDPELRDLVEWQYQRAVKDIPKKEQPDLDTWISNLKADPSKATEALRPFLKSEAPAAPPEATQEAPQPPQPPQIETMDRQQLIELAMEAYKKANQNTEAQQHLQQPPTAPIKNHSSTVLPKPPTEAGNIVDRALADRTGQLWKKHNKEIQEYVRKEKITPAAFLGRAYKYPQK